MKLLRYVLILAMVACSAPAPAWEAVGHTTVTEHALQLLPKEMKPFYDANSRYIIAFCMLPDDWRDSHKAEIAYRHFIDLDMLSKPPFTDLRVDRATAERRFGKEQLQKAGVLPWAIEEEYNKLVKAMKAGDSVGIALQSALLAHYVADAHVPMHDTKLYDGRTQDEKGIHNRWEATLLLDRLKPGMVNACEPAKVGPILQSAFDWCIEGYSKCDAIFDADDAARKLDPTFGYKYETSMWTATGPIMIDQLDRASERLAGTWISAWKAAGKPDIPGKCAPFMWR